MISQIADNALTRVVLIGHPRGLHIQELGSDRIGVWLPDTPRYDLPDGIGDTVSEALELAARKVRL
jgi:hypothetical protein